MFETFDTIYLQFESRPKVLISPKNPRQFFNCAPRFLAATCTTRRVWLCTPTTDTGESVPLSWEWLLKEQFLASALWWQITPKLIHRCHDNGLIWKWPAQRCLAKRSRIYEEQITFCCGDRGRFLFSSTLSSCTRFFLASDGKVSVAPHERCDHVCLCVPRKCSLRAGRTGRCTRSGTVGGSISSSRETRRCRHSSSSGSSSSSGASSGASQCTSRCVPRALRRKGCGYVEYNRHSTEGHFATSWFCAIFPFCAFSPACNTLKLSLSVL